MNTAEREIVIDLLSSLVAAVSLLKRGSKEAAPSDRMFDLMIADYERAIARGAAAFAGDQVAVDEIERLRNEQPTDCYHRKLPGEPHFTLLARDPMFAAMVRQWADYRGQLIACGELPESDREQVLNARLIAAQGIEWRYRHNGEWRK
jgi:hypothetical protein